MSRPEVSWIAYDINKRKPGCPLVQAALSKTVDVSLHFRPEAWVPTTTEDMKLYPVTKAQLARLVEMTKDTTNDA